MTTYDYLNQSRKLYDKIERKKQEIAEYHDTIQRIKAITNEERVQSSPMPDKIGSSIAKLIEMENEVDKIVEKYIDTTEKIARQIDDLPNEQQSKVLYYYFIKRLSVEQIENQKDFAKGNGISRGHIYKLRREGIKNFENMYLSQNATR